MKIFIDTEFSHSCGHVPWYIRTMIAIIHHLQHATRTTTFELNGSPDASFNLFTPTGEKLWAHHGWEPRRVDGTGAPDNEGMTFRNGSGKSLWVVKRLSKEERVVEYLIVSDDMLTDLRCEVTPGANGRAVAKVTYDWRALTEAGNAMVEEHEAHFEAMLQEWAHAMNAALAR